MANYLDNDIKFVAGVGEARARLLEKELGIRTLGDMLSHYPFRYIDRTRIYRISEITDAAGLSYVQFRARVTGVAYAGAGRKRRFTAFVQDVLREVQSKGEFTDEATLARIRERLQEMLSGEEGIFGPMKNPEYATDTPPAGKKSATRAQAFRSECLERPSPRIEAYLRRNGLYGYDGQERQEENDR